ncbi:MAG: F0F1 ATP synthase subunit B [Verrucomicrobiota bacterium]|nr:F0F1 ATP synthase subunit B [Verrucomicrobiota bacterium]HCF95053.1 ATP synthase F0 subunit B [Verrucomicrobiota bacterium]
MFFMNHLPLQSRMESHLLGALLFGLCLSLTQPAFGATPSGAADGTTVEAASGQEAHPTDDGHGDATHQLFDPKSIVWTMISFLLVLGALGKFVFPALNETMKKREAAMRGSIEEAQRTREEAHKLLQQYEERLGQARQEAQAILEESRKVADQVRKEFLAKSQEEATQMVQRAQAEIQQAKARGIEDLKQTVGELSLRLAAEVVRHDIDETKHHALVDEFLDNLQSLELSNRSS